MKRIQLGITTCCSTPSAHAVYINRNTYEIDADCLEQDDLLIHCNTALDVDTHITMKEWWGQPYPPVRLARCVDCDTELTLWFWSWRG